jgi:hypothetical protein
MGRPTFLAALLSVMMAVIGCSADRVDREAAVARVVDESAGRITREQAGCYVDRVLDELGEGPLRPGAVVPPEQIGRLTALRVDCIGVANLGPEPSTATTPGSVARELAGPKRRGDSAPLDALWDDCEMGFGLACDQLFDQSLPGSEYEDFGVTCGRRTREEQCAVVYPSPGVTLPSPAQPTTTVPPPSP